MTAAISERSQLTVCLYVDFRDNSLWKLNLSNRATIFIYSKELVSLFGGGEGLSEGLVGSSLSVKESHSRQSPATLPRNRFLATLNRNLALAT